MDEDNITVWGALIFFVIMIIIACCVGVTDSSAVNEYAEIEGWENVKLTGYSFYSCGHDDWYHTGFTATKNGHPISGTVCSGLFFKGKTLRLN